MEEEKVELISEWPVTTSQQDSTMTERQQASATKALKQHYWRSTSTWQHRGSVTSESQSASSAKEPPVISVHKMDSEFRTTTDMQCGEKSMSFGNFHCSKSASDSPHTASSMVACKRHSMPDESYKDVPAKHAHLSEPESETQGHFNINENWNESNPEYFVDSENRCVVDGYCLLKMGNSSDSSGAGKDRPRELLVQARLARWWRREGQCIVGSKHETLPNSANPNTLLFHVARLPQGREFLEEELQHLRQKVEQTEVTADLLAALASVEEWLGKLDDAVFHLEKATTIEPDDKEYQWLLHKAVRQLTIRCRQTELLPSVPSMPEFPPSCQVGRVSAKNLTFLEFFHNYAMARVPVIITDLASTMTKVPWDIQHIADVAGDCVAQVKQSVKGSVEWAGLEESRIVRVSEFLQNLHNRHDYLFDWSLPLHCPHLAEELTIPRYFAGDFLQRTNAGSLYQDSWPSLFVAPPGLHSELHVDAFASNFWMALFQGRKRWVFFRQEDIPCLYPVYANSLDPTFEAIVTAPDLKAHPLLSLVQTIECILSAGEILFVPAGCPHYVENLDTTIAISANFVDLSNWRKVLQELHVNGLMDARAADLARQFRQPAFDSRMRSDMDDLPWRVFKTWPPSDTESFEMTEESVEAM